MSNLINHAERELTYAGLRPEVRPESPDDYSHMCGDAALELVQAFAAQGHSGMSASITLSMFERLARFKPLTPIGTTDDEWQKISDEPCWQNRRRSSTFSRDAGKTWYDIDDSKLNHGDRWLPRRTVAKRRIRRLFERFTA